MPSPIQNLILLETLLNITAIVPLLLYPHRTLSLILNPSLPPTITTLTPLTIFLARTISILFIALTVQLLLAYPHSSGCAERRRLVYYTMSAGETGLIPLLVWEALKAGNATGSEIGAFSGRIAVLGLASLAPSLAGRVWVFARRPEWFEGERGKVVAEKGGKRD